MPYRPARYCVSKRTPIGPAGRKRQSPLAVVNVIVPGFCSFVAHERKPDDTAFSISAAIWFERVNQTGALSDTLVMMSSDNSPWASGGVPACCADAKAQHGRAACANRSLHGCRDKSRKAECQTRLRLCWTISHSSSRNFAHAATEALATFSNVGLCEGRSGNMRSPCEGARRRRCIRTANHVEMSSICIKTSPGNEDLNREISFIVLAARCTH